jgi:hypothetical protein
VFGAAEIQIVTPGEGRFPCLIGFRALSLGVHRAAILTSSLRSPSSVAPSSASTCAGAKIANSFDGITLFEGQPPLGHLQSAKFDPAKPLTRSIRPSEQSRKINTVGCRPTWPSALKLGWTRDLYSVMGNRGLRGMASEEKV